MTIISRVTRY